MPTMFLGYPENPASLSEVMHRTAHQLSTKATIDANTWQDLKVDGHVVLSRILSAIDAADAALFDLTYLNQNVLFELGYAIGRAKPVRVSIDSTVEGAEKRFGDLAILRNIGYTEYHNSADLTSRLLANPPWSEPTTVYDDLIEPLMSESDRNRDAILYFKTYEAFEASSRLSTFIDEQRGRGLTVLVADPQESGFEPLTWVVPALMRSAGVIVHFAGPHRNNSFMTNFRHAIAAGLARGLELPTLMLAEDEYEAPFDYEDALKSYSFARECVNYAREWLGEIVPHPVDWSKPSRSRTSKLTAMKFGEHVAENEIDELASYFVPTSAYSDVIAAKDTIFVGHRGTGKTANAVQALDQLRANKTVCAVLIKPPAFETPDESFGLAASENARSPRSRGPAQRRPDVTPRRRLDSPR